LSWSIENAESSCSINGKKYWGGCEMCIFENLAKMLEFFLLCVLAIQSSDCFEQWDISHCLV